MCGTSKDLPLKVKAVLRETTDKAETLERSVMMSSLIPSLKYSCCGSSLMLANGSTQMDSLDAARVERAGVDRARGPPARSATLAATLRQPGESASPSQPANSAH